MHPIDAACVSIWPSDYHAKFNGIAIRFKAYGKGLAITQYPLKYPHVYQKTDCS